MRADFYQLGQAPAEAALPLIARATLRAGERLVVVSGDASQLARISEALWAKIPDSFLAHGQSGAEQEERHPILLSGDAAARNGARYMAIADGVWRDGEPPFERTFFFFNDSTLQAARDCWRMLGTREGLDRRFWKQQDGKWVEGP